MNMKRMYMYNLFIGRISCLYFLLTFLSFLSFSSLTLLGRDRTPPQGGKYYIGSSPASSSRGSSSSSGSSGSSSSSSSKGSGSKSYGSSGGYSCDKESAVSELRKKNDGKRSEILPREPVPGERENRPKQQVKPFKAPATTQLAKSITQKTMLTPELGRLYENFEQEKEHCYATQNHALALRYEARAYAIHKTTQQNGKKFDYSSAVTTPHFTDEYASLFNHRYGTELDKHLHVELCANRMHAIKLNEKNTTIQTQALVPLINQLTARAKVESNYQTAFHLSDVSTAFIDVVKGGVSLLGSALHTIGKGLVALDQGIDTAMLNAANPRHWVDLAYGTGAFICTTMNPCNWAKVAKFLWEDYSVIFQKGVALCQGDREKYEKIAQEHDERRRAQLEPVLNHLIETRKKIKEMSWEEVVKNGSTLGASFFIDTALLGTASNIMQGGLSRVKNALAKSPIVEGQAFASLARSAKKSSSTPAAQSEAQLATQSQPQLPLIQQAEEIIETSPQLPVAQAESIAATLPTQLPTPAVETIRPATGAAAASSDKINKAINEASAAFSAFSHEELALEASLNDIASIAKIASESSLESAEVLAEIASRNPGIITEALESLQSIPHAPSQPLPGAVGTSSALYLPAKLSPQIICETVAKIDQESNLVWRHMIITPGTPNWPSTKIPQRFEFNIEGTRLWVTDNATKHLGEHILGGSLDTTQLQDWKRLSHSAPCRSQIILTSLYEKLKKAVALNIPAKVERDREIMETLSIEKISKNDLFKRTNWYDTPWELNFVRNKESGPLPKLIHAVYKPYGLKKNT